MHYWDPEMGLSIGWVQLRLGYACYRSMLLFAGIIVSLESDAMFIRIIYFSTTKLLYRMVSWTVSLALVSMHYNSFILFLLPPHLKLNNRNVYTYKIHEWEFGNINMMCKYNMQLNLLANFIINIEQFNPPLKITTSWQQYNYCCCLCMSIDYLLLIIFMFHTNVKQWNSIDTLLSPILSVYI